MQSSGVSLLPSIHAATGWLSKVATAALRAQNPGVLASSDPVPPTVVSPREAALRRIAAARLTASLAELAEQPRRATKALRRAAFQADCFAAGMAGGDAGFGVLADAAVLLARRGRVTELRALLEHMGGQCMQLDAGHAKEGHARAEALEEALVGALSDATGSEPIQLIPRMGMENAA